LNWTEITQQTQEPRYSELRLDTVTPPN